MFGEYIPSNSGTVDTLTLSDGRQIQVSAVDGDSPYIVSGNASNNNFVQAVRSNPAFSRQDPQQVEFIEYARGMDGQSVGPQFHTGSGSSRGVSKSSNQTSGSRRGQSLIPQEQSGKQSNQLRARRPAQTSSSQRRQADSRFSGRNTARQPELIEYARGMDGQSAGPQYSGGSSRGVSKSSSQTSGSRRGQSLIPQEQSGKHSNQLRARRPASQSRSTSRNRDTFSRNVDMRGMSTTVDLQSIRNNQNIARQMLNNISNAGVNAVNAYLALRALEGYAEDPTTAQNAAEERQMYTNLRNVINQAMNNPERIRLFVEEEALNFLIYAQSSYEDRKSTILRRLGQ
jgi:hypothetical protein